MYEMPPSFEQPKITIEQVVQTITVNGKDNPETIKTIGAFWDQEKEQIQTIKDKVEQYRAEVAFAMQYAEGLYNAGLYEEAWDALDGSFNHAHNIGDADLEQRLNALADTIEAKL